VIATILSHLRKLYWFDPSNLTQDLLEYGEKHKLSTVITTDSLPIQQQEKIKPLVVKYFSDAKGFPIRTQIGHKS
jgi:hypothetical protein